MSTSNLLVSKGDSSRLGVHKTSEGVNFAFISSDAEEAEILIFAPDSDEPFFIASLSSSLHTTGNIWHALIENLSEPFEYSYKIFKGSWSPLLIDPYAKAIRSSSKWKEQSSFPNKSRFFSIPSFDWEQTEKPKTPFKDWIIYEMHVRAFSMHSSSNSQNPGTFLGVIEKIPYLKTLGVNAIELLPVFEFNESENLLKNPETQETLCNFWGYSPVSFFAPMARYASKSDWEAPILEFKEMVRELHRNGIAVILDVVYNHTGEKGEDGSTFCFKGLDPTAYYLFDSQGSFYNFSGTGNTLNCNHPTTLKLIVDSLIYWAQEMQVDGFRFDLASILARGVDGNPLAAPPILTAIENEPTLKDTIFIAEAWDASGFYQVGSFPGKTWAEWNGEFRDVCRNFIKGSPHFLGEFAQAICGSQNLYWEDSPLKSINFITSHDGYSLNDLVSYEDKYNLANGEFNRDGNNNNCSWNCGVEGPTSNRKILQLRSQQMKNFAVCLFLSLGVPMMLMGDEYGHTRRGNNNPYCQDNELNWFLWDELKKNKGMFRFFQEMISLRKRLSHLICLNKFFTDQDIDWHGDKLFSPQWNSDKNLLSYSLKDRQYSTEYFICFNAQDSSALVQLPNLNDQLWHQIVDTSLPPPYDFADTTENAPIYQNSYLLSPYSCVILKSSLFESG